MRINFFGANCLAIKSATSRLVVDDNLAKYNQKSITTSSDIVCLTNPDLDRKSNTQLIIDSAGSYEIGDFLIKGFQVEGYSEGSESVIYRVLAGKTNINALIVGHVNPEKLPDSIFDEIEEVDILMLPVGGAGLTLTAQQANEIAKKIDPRTIIPTFYKLAGFDQDLSSYQEFVNQVSTPSEMISDSLAFTSRNKLPDNKTVYILKE